MKTKNKLDQLKLVMQQKKERREARKMKVIPYNTQHGLHGSLIIPSSATSTIVHVPQLTTVSSMTGNLLMPGSSSKVTSHLTDSADTSSSSSATATAIATTISSSTSEIENHLEEVDTVA